MKITYTWHTLVRMVLNTAWQFIRYVFDLHVVHAPQGEFDIFIIFDFAKYNSTCLT